MDEAPDVMERAPVDPFEPSIGLLGVLRTLFKWSFVVAPLMALTIFLALSQSEDIKPEFTAEASLLLLGPNEVVIEDLDTGELDVTSVNPLQQLGGTLNTVARVTVLALSDASVPEQLVSEGLTDAYVIGAEARIPILRIEVVDVDESIAEATLDRLVQMVFDDLDARQDVLGAPESNRVGAQLISSGVAGGPDFSARTRVRIAIAAIGFAISVAAAFFLEGLAELWRRRKRKRQLPTQRSLPTGEPPADRLTGSRAKSAEALVESERDTLVSLLHLVTGDEALSDEIADSACDSVIEDWDEVQHREPAEWLYALAIREAWAQDDTTFASSSSDSELWVALARMPKERRAVLALASIADFTDARIASTLNFSVARVQSHRDDGATTLSKMTDATPDREGPLAQAGKRRRATNNEAPKNSRKRKRNKRAKNSQTAASDRAAGNADVAPQARTGLTADRPAARGAAPTIATDTTDPSSITPDTPDNIVHDTADATDDNESAPETSAPADDNHADNNNPAPDNADDSRADDADDHNDDDNPAPDTADDNPAPDTADHNDDDNPAPDTADQHNTNENPAPDTADHNDDDNPAPDTADHNADQHNTDENPAPDTADHNADQHNTDENPAPDTADHNTDQHNTDENPALDTADHNTDQNHADDTADRNDDENHADNIDSDDNPAPDTADQNNDDQNHADSDDNRADNNGEYDNRADNNGEYDNRADDNGEFNDSSREVREQTDEPAQ